MQIINRVAAGEITKKQKYVYTLDEDSSKEIDVASLSTGLKAFVILKQLLLNGNLQDKDVIVLDEPEIHLHPEWQMLYAEIIVLLQKKYNFHIVVTTHSAHFWKHWSYIRKSIKQVRDAITIWQIYRKKALFLKMLQTI